MKSENLIHIKFEYDSALESKKDILASEIDLLKISQRLSRYKESREKELDIKLKAEKKVKALKSDIIKLQDLLPKIKIPKILKPEAESSEKEEVEEEIITPRIKEEGKSQVEMELEEIQRKLGSLQK